MSFNCGLYVKLCGTSIDRRLTNGDDNYLHSAHTGEARPGTAGTYWTMLAKPLVAKNNVASFSFLTEKV